MTDATQPQEREPYRVMYLVVTKDKQERIVGFEDACRVYSDWVEEFDFARLYREEYQTEKEYEAKEPYYTRLIEKHN